MYSCLDPNPRGSDLIGLGGSLASIIFKSPWVIENHWVRRCAKASLEGQRVIPILCKLHRGPTVPTSKAIHDASFLWDKSPYSPPVASNLSTARYKSGFYISGTLKMPLTVALGEKNQMWLCSIESIFFFKGIKYSLPCWARRVDQGVAMK